MGTLGVQTFENDDASEWALDLEVTKDASLLKLSLNPGESAGGVLEAADGVLVLCAAEVVAGIARSPRKGIPENVLAWIAAHRGLSVTALVPLAIAGVERVLSDKSKLNKLWAEHKADYPMWKEDVLGLLAALKGQSQQPSPIKRPWWKFW